MLLALVVMFVAFVSALVSTVLTCPIVATSVSSTPSATLVRRRLSVSSRAVVDGLSTRPKETVVESVVSELAPIATDDVWVARKL